MTTESSPLPDDVPTAIQYLEVKVGHEAQAPTTQAESEARTWWIVSQVKSYRVVYFTDDTDYTPVMHGSWYYVSPYRGDIPAAMTLRNCWRWRFDGHTFTDTQEPSVKSSAQKLLDANKAALMQLLSEKINALRQPLLPTCVSGESVRGELLAQAQALLREQAVPCPDKDGDTYLFHAAAAAHCTVEHMAHTILQRDQAQRTLIHATEIQRIHLAAAIQRATTQEQLLALRQRLMEELAPQVDTGPTSTHTTPQDMQGVMPTATLKREQLRLMVQLREKINDLRRPYISQYLLDEVVLEHKCRVAEAVIAHAGAMPVDTDGSILMSHAAARGQTLLVAAHEVLAEANETAQALLASEQLKDAWSVRIAAARTYEDCAELGRKMAKLSLPPLS